MSAHNHPFEAYRAPVEKADPGDAGSIGIDRSPMVVNLVSGAAAQTRTLARPTQQGAVCCLQFKTDGGGDITVTVTGGYNETGDTTLVFANAGEFAEFRSYFDGSAFFWRLTSNHNVGNVGVGLTATVAELNQAIGDGDEVVITTNVITAAENGKTFYLSLAAGFTSTLPAPALGLRFRFIVKTAPTGAPYVITTDASGNIMYGQMLERAGGAGVAGAARDTFNFVHNQSIIGDWVEFYSDGTNWYYHGMVDVAAGNTVAQT